MSGAYLIREIKAMLRDPVKFTDRLSGITLRRYQVEVVREVVESVLQRQGRSFVVIFPRQSGKNELQAQIEAYLLLRLSQTSAEIIKISPTWKPQSLNAMRRLERALQNNLLTRGLWVREQGYIYRVGQARVFFLSGAPEANIVGATASALLEVDEAQDILIAKFDRDVAPMAASTNATRVFWGTAWTSRTLLARELRAAREAEREEAEANSGRFHHRVFVLTADDVAAEVPAYGRFVTDQVAKLGRGNPMVRTQFYSAEIDAEGGMFPPARLGLMQGPGGYDQAQAGPSAGKLYALLVDVAGEDESAVLAAAPGASDNANGAGASAGGLANPGRDATACTVVEVDLSALAETRLPAYKVAFRCTWVGVRQTALYNHLLAMAGSWRARYLVIDATGVGAGLASFLDKALPGKVRRFIFNASSKSKLGWDFLGIVDSGRWKEYRQPDEMQSLFFRQLAAAQYEVAPGPSKIMRWGVPDGTRDPASGELVHDDLVLSAALAGALDELEWGISSGPDVVARARDPLEARRPREEWGPREEGGDEF